MKRTALIFLLLAAACHSSMAQKRGQARIDSLLGALPSAKDDTGKVNLLADLSFTYYSIDPDTGIKYGMLSLRLAEELGWKTGIANANRTIGVNYSYGKSEYSTSLDYFAKALGLFEALNDKYGEAKVLSNIGVVHWYRSDYPKALEYYFKALKIDEYLGDKNGMAGTLANIGIVYNSQGDYEKALQYMIRGNELDESLGNKQGIANNLGNIGEVYRRLGNYRKALEYDSTSLVAFKDLGDQMGIARNLGNMGSVYSGLKDHEKALEYYFKALAISRELGLSVGTAMNLSNIGATYLSIASDSNRVALDKLFDGNKINAQHKAKSYIDSAIAISKEIGDLNALANNFEGLSEIQTLLGEFENALVSYRTYTALKDSIFNMEKNKKLTETALQYEFDKKEAASKAEQEKKDIRQKNIRNSIAAGLAGSLIFLLIVYRQRFKIAKEKQKSDELLLNILPGEVAEELKSTGRAKAKSFTLVTVMFTDFKDFTNISEKVSAELLVDEINYCFSAFDQIIQKHRIEKIKTIGDAYLCAAGLPVSNYTHAVDMVSAALDILDFMKRRKKEKEDKGEIPFELRIGIHTGPVVAGIVGVKKYAYDIWGDTVNLAARMEQNSEPGKINISGSTFELVKDQFNCNYRGKIEAKHKGMVDMYFVEPK